MDVNKIYPFLLNCQSRFSPPVSPSFFANPPSVARLLRRTGATKESATPDKQSSVRTTNGEASSRLGSTGSPQVAPIFVEATPGKLSYVGTTKGEILRRIKFVVREA